MTRFTLGLAFLIAFLVAGCAGEANFEDRSDEVWVKQRRHR